MASKYPWVTDNALQCYQLSSWKQWLRFFPRSEAGNRKWTHQRSCLLSEIHVICVSWLPICLLTVILSPVRHIRVRGHLTLIHTNKTSAGIRGRNFLQPVIDTSKVQESSTWKVPFQHFLVTRPHSARSTTLFYWTKQGKQLRFMSHVALCTNILLS